eukprot:2462447-Amphidinium_carterae.1
MIRDKAKYNQRHPPLKVGDQVRTYIKPGSFKKGFRDKWSREVHTIVHITNDKRYTLNDQNVRKKLWLRHDLLKVDAEEDKDN